MENDSPAQRTIDPSAIPGRLDILQGQIDMLRMVLVALIAAAKNDEAIQSRLLVMWADLQTTLRHPSPGEPEEARFIRQGKFDGANQAWNSLQEALSGL